MGYYIDLETIIISDYKTKLKTAYLPPSRMILREQLDERFDYFSGIGIKNVKELQQTLKKKNQLKDLSKVKCLSEEYLTILLREINSILPKPNRIKEFSGISKETVSKLEKIGIKNTVKLYDRIINAKSRKELALETDISDSEILELTRLTDLSRIKWVGASFARIFYDLEFDSLEKVSNANPIELHTLINQFNKEKIIFKGHIGLNDVRICINAAKEIPLEIEY